MGDAPIDPILRKRYSEFQVTAVTIMDAVHILEDFESIASYGRNQNSMYYQA